MVTNNDNYNDLKKTFDYDKKKATRLAEAMTEAVEVEKRLKYLKTIMDNNTELRAFLWQTQEGQVKALHDIDDEHLANIVGFKAKHGSELSEEMRAEAESRGIDVDTITETTPRLKPFVDYEDYYQQWED